MSDRLKTALRAASAVDPLVRYRCLYRAKVLGQSGDLQKVSVRPFDSSLPDMADIPLRHGVPGIKVQVQRGCTVQVGWDDGRPDRPFAALWSAEASALRVCIVSPSVEIGTANPTDFAVLGTSQLEQLSSAFTTIAGALTGLGKIQEGMAIMAVVAQLPMTLSPHVRLG